MFEEFKENPKLGVQKLIVEIILLILMAFLGYGIAQFFNFLTLMGL